jgi:hypothetical protein
LVATTFSGLGSSKALAGSSHSKTAVTRTIAERLDPVESVFVFGDDLDAAEPTVELCFDALSADEDAEARAAEGFATFHELAFDFADALK